MMIVRLFSLEFRPRSTPTFTWDAMSTANGYESNDLTRCPTSPRLFVDYDPQVTGYKTMTTPRAALIGRVFVLDFDRLADGHRNNYHYLMPPM
jgi:hypothetical protein